MKTFIKSFARKALHDQRGQVLPWVALGTLALLGLGGLGIDVGRAYVAQTQLQNDANAAVLASAGAVYNSSTTDNSNAVATQYSASGGDKNASSTNLGTINTVVSTKCLNLLMPSGSTCSSSTPANAVRVTESATLNTYFMRLLGENTVTVAATATASMQGIAEKWNVAVIVDGTNSMGNADSDCGGMSEFQCALNGVQALLQSTNPCPPGVSNCNAANSNLRVALFSFPNLSTANFSNTAICTSTLAHEPYTLPLTTATTYAPIQYSSAWSGSSPSSGSTNWTATYQVSAWDASYYDPSDSGGLNTSDNVVKAIGNSGTSTAVGNKGCFTNVGGESTYHAGVLYAAQAALVQEQGSFPGSQNAIILLSDGQANAASAKFPWGQSPAVTTLAAKGLSTATSGTSAGNYPSTVDECQQAILAARAATNAGTTVYAVAYGSESTGCSSSSGGTDSTTIATGTNQSFTASTITPCITMENIASTLDYFYSDYNQSGSGSTCQDNSHSVVSLQGIFQAIAASFTKPRLLPNNAT